MKTFYPICGDLTLEVLKKRERGREEEKKTLEEIKKAMALDNDLLCLFGESPIHPSSSFSSSHQMDGQCTIL